jgi:K+-sensing histidine kinase KdpD
VRVRSHQLLREHPTATVVAAVAAPVVVAAVLAPFRDSLTQTTDVLVLVALVVAFSATGLRAAGLAAVVSAAASFDFFLTAPYHSFAITGANDLEAAALLLVIGGLVTETALWGLRTDAALSKEVGYVDGVLATAESVSANASGPEEQARQVSQRICVVLNLDSCRFELGSGSDPSAPTLHQDGSVTRAGRDVDVNRDGLPVDSVVVLPVRSRGELRARFLLTAASHVARPNERQRRVAVLLADQIASTLDGQSARDG